MVERRVGRRHGIRVGFRAARRVMHWVGSRVPLHTVGRTGHIDWSDGDSGCHREHKKRRLVLNVYCVVLGKQ